MYDITNFNLRDMTELGIALRSFGEMAESLEEVANLVAHCLYERFVDAETGEKVCALVRFYKTYSYEMLDPELREFADHMLGDHAVASPSMKCLTLLATVGEKPEWNSRKNSAGHQAIPLPSEQVVLQLPMISQLVKQFGLELNAFLETRADIILETAQNTFNVFHVPDALNSPYVPAQEEFVRPLGIKSALGFGGMLPSAELFAIIMFSKAPISRATADMFKVLALNTKVALLSLTEEAIFAGASLVEAG